MAKQSGGAGHNFWTLVSIFSGSVKRLVMEHVDSSSHWSTWRTKTLRLWRLCSVGFQEEVTLQDDRSQELGCSGGMPTADVGIDFPNFELFQIMKSQGIAIWGSTLVHHISWEVTLFLFSFNYYLGYGWCPFQSCWQNHLIVIHMHI